jgi:tetratricopeptide (TPR) repeat protein
MSSASVPSENHKRAEIYFQTGTDAAQKGNLDYAIQMCQDACKLHPENLKYRQFLRGFERRKFGNDPTRVSKLSGARNQPIRMKARSKKSQGKFTEALELCEQAFVNNPWDVAAVREAAETAEAMGQKELAEWLVESVHGQANDIDFFRFAAHIHESNESWAKAIYCWERVKKINPYDEDASRQINALSASATIKRAGLGEAVGKRSTSDSIGEKLAGELDELKQQQVPPEVRLRREIQENPSHVSPYLQLVDIYKMRNQLDEAEKLLADALKSIPLDPTLRLVYAEIQIQRIDRAIKQLTQVCREKPNDVASKAKLDKLQQTKVEYEVKEFKRRAELHPEDQHVQYELGLRLARAEKYDEAIIAFQQARSHIALKLKALHQVGLCFEAKGALKLAERAYQDALKALEAEDVAMFNTLHYRLGRVAEAQGNVASAEEHYNEVAANDYGYQDVAQRLQNLGT